MLEVFLKTLPFFMLIGVGYVAAATKFFSDSAAAALTRFVFYFALSSMLFRFSANLSFGEVFDARFMGVYLQTVAVALLGILTVSTLLTLIPVSRQTRLNREMEAASSAVRDLMERVHATTFSEIPDLYPDGTVVALAALDDGEVTIGYEDINADPLVISFDLAWDSEQIGQMNRTFVTVKTE